ncbi:exportin-T [Trypanosoma brucei equiperdum]|uniref:Exportin-T n=1 Tax=Trypanosoma brucei equiperdum TaxID=630700 RepID=A0A3L6LF74_9TRYP|nr:exportin-T [Trypanosoma brucei equiperdum]
MSQLSSPIVFSMESFTQAMELTHTYQPGVTQQQRQEAEQYLMELRVTADGLNLAFGIINSEPVQDTCCFWAFNTIMHHLPRIARDVDDTKAEELYKTLFSFIYRYFFSSNAPTSVSGASLIGLTATSSSTVNCTVLSGVATGTRQRQSIDYLANKHAQMMVAGLQEFFPSRWRSFFDDAFELINRGASLQQHIRDSVTLYILRLFEYIDERVVSVRERSDRSRDQRARDMELKDAMREHVIPRATAFWHATLCECRQRVPELANICMSIVQTYIEWVDISLFFTAEWINLLYFMLSADTVRGAACECLCGLVEKKQVPAAKLESLRKLNVVDAVPRVVSLVPAPPESDEDVNFTESVAKLVREVSMQFLSLYEHITSNRNNYASWGGVSGARGNHANMSHNSSSAETATSPPSLSCVRSTESLDAEGGIDCTNVDCRNFQGRQQQQHSYFVPDGHLSVEFLGEVQVALDVVVPELLRLLSIRHDVVVDTLIPFIQMYIKSSALREEQAAQLLRALYDHTVIGGVAENEEPFWMDDIIDRRKQMHNIMRLLFRDHPAVVMPHLREVVARAASSASGPTTASAEGFGQTGVMGQDKDLKSHGIDNISNGRGLNCEGISAAVGGSSNTASSPEEAEAALRYLYELGESFRMEQLRDSSNEFAQLIFAVLTSEHLPQHTCSVVHVSCFEVLDRYCVFFTYHRNYIPLLLQRLLLMPHGVMNSSPNVRARICYLFGHLVQVLKSSLVPHAQDIITALQRILAATEYLLPSNRRDLYEAIGILLSTVPQLPAAGATEGTAMTLHVVQVVRQNLRDASVVGNIACAEAVADGISFLTALVKGLRGGGGGGSSGSGAAVNNATYTSPNKNSSGSGSNACSESIKINNATDGNSVSESTGEAVVAEVFHNVTSDVMEVFSTWHASPSVRDRIVQYFTQMAHLLPFDSMKVYVPVYTSNWLMWMEAVQELIKLLRFLLQFIHRSGPCVAEILSQLMPPLLEKVSAVGELSAEDDQSDIVSETMREQRDVYRQLFAVVHGAAQAQCAHVILFLPSVNLNALLVQLLTAIQLPGETELPKIALQIMTKVTATVEPCCTNNESSGAGRHPLRNDCSQGSTGAAGEAWMKFMLNDALRVVFARMLSPTFDLKDAKSLLFIGETGLLLKALMNKLGPADASLSVMLYETFSPLVGESEATGFISALQQQPGRFSTEMKMRFCNMLKFARQHYAA